MGKSKGKPQVSGFSGRTVGKMLSNSHSPLTKTQPVKKKKK